ncbi:MAG TPA: hypothetical protein VIJ79_00230 [Acidobacteriaceae bacterium]
MRGLLLLALSFTLTACAQATITSPGKSDDAIRADMNSCDTGSLTLHDRSVIDCFNVHGDTITYADGRMPPFTFSNPYNMPLTASEVQQRKAAANIVLERWKAAARESAQSASVTAQPSQQNPDGTSVAPSQSSMPSQPQGVSQDDPTTVKPPAPAGTNSQPTSTASAANEDTPSQDKPGWLARVATATKNLVDGFHNYQKNKDQADQISDNQNFDKYFDVKSAIFGITIRSRVDGLILTGFSANGGRCSAYNAKVYTIERVKFPVRLGYDQQVTFDVDGSSAASVRVQDSNLCHMLDMEIDTNFGSWTWEFH